MVANGSESKSSFSKITMRPSGISYPLAISANGISLPHFSHTLLYLMRPPSSGWTWRKLMSFSSVAEKSFTGIVTRPKEMAPFQIERGMRLVCPIRGNIRRITRRLKVIQLIGCEPQQIVALQQLADLWQLQRRRQCDLSAHSASRAALSSRFGGLRLSDKQGLHLSPGKR